jgi:hypothetical protein
VTKTEDERFVRTDARAVKEAPEHPDEWRLPSGQSLAEFALESGLLARRLIAPRRKSAVGRGRGWARES